MKQTQLGTGNGQGRAKTKQKRTSDLNLYYKACRRIKKNGLHIY